MGLLAVSVASTGWFKKKASQMNYQNVLKCFSLNRIKARQRRTILNIRY